VISCGAIRDSAVNFLRQRRGFISCPKFRV
jgi:hypothetical protein